MSFGFVDLLETRARNYQPKRGNSMDTYRIHENLVLTAGASNKAPPALPLLDIRLERFSAQVSALAELKKRADAALDRVMGPGLPRVGVECADGDSKMPCDALSKLDRALERNQDLLDALAFQVNRLESL